MESEDDYRAPYIIGEREPQDVPAMWCAALLIEPFLAHNSDEETVMAIGILVPKDREHELEFAVVRHLEDGSMIADREGCLWPAPDEPVAAEA